MTVTSAVSVTALNAVGPPLVVVLTSVSAHAAGCVPCPVGNRGCFGVCAVRGVLQVGAVGQQQCRIICNRAQVGERRAVERIGPSSLARRAGHRDAAYYGVRSASVMVVVPEPLLMNFARLTVMAAVRVVVPSDGPAGVRTGA